MEICIYVLRKHLKDQSYFILHIDEIATHVKLI